MKPRVLVVDDDESVRSQLAWGLAPDIEILPAEDRVSAMLAFEKKRPDAVLLDLGLPPMPNGPEEGLALLHTLVATDPQTKVIVASGLSDRQSNLRALKSGAFDFLSKPVELDRLRLVLQRAFRQSELERDYDEMRRQTRRNDVEALAGTSPAMQNVFASIRRLATTDLPVLVTGEAGTGKEAVARAIHLGSHRKDGPFIVVNCGAIPEGLIEGELFGCEEKTSAETSVRVRGRLEASDGGTLFLDDADELPSGAQALLARFLRDGRFRRVEGRHELEANARIIAATTADLKIAVLKGAFSNELYGLLSVATVSLPPLRERTGDVELLAAIFLQRAVAKAGKHDIALDPEALQALKAYHWPGNVRELADRVRRAVVLAGIGPIRAADLDLIAPPASSSTTTLKEAREAVERDVILQALERTNHNISRAAAELGISRPTLYDLMDKLGIGKPAATTSKNRPDSV